MSRLWGDTPSNPPLRQTSAQRTAVQLAVKSLSQLHSPQYSANQALRCYTEVTVDTTRALGCVFQLAEGILWPTLAHVCSGTKSDVRSLSITRGVRSTK